MQPHTPTILTIEHDTDTREFYELLLSSAGYQIITASTGQTGLHDTRLSHVDAVIVDWRLPDMNSIDLCQQLRMRLGANVPILLMSTDYSADLPEMAKTAGATEFIKKPFSPDTLLNHLAALISTS